jgi:hypothetical protein
MHWRGIKSKQSNFVFREIRGTSSLGTPEELSETPNTITGIFIVLLFAGRR